MVNADLVSIACRTEYDFNLEIWPSGLVEVRSSCCHGQVLHVGNPYPCVYYCRSCRGRAFTADTKLPDSAGGDGLASYLETLIRAVTDLDPLAATLEASKLADEVELVKPQ